MLFSTSTKFRQQKVKIVHACIDELRKELMTRSSDIVLIKCAKSVRSEFKRFLNRKRHKISWDQLLT